MITSIITYTLISIAMIVVIVSFEYCHQLTSSRYYHLASLLALLLSQMIVTIARSGLFLSRSLFVLPHLIAANRCHRE